jgi:Fur family transcriptional regulator, ferric uptake regulator
MRDPLEALRAVLAERGGRRTRARESVLQAFLSDRRPLTPRDVHRRAGRDADLASVYRNIQFLLEAGILARVDRVAGGERFELSEKHRGHHHHLICERCGGVEDLEGCLLEDVERRVRKKTRFRVTRHEVNLFGLCHSCGGAGRG